MLKSILELIDNVNNLAKNDNNPLCNQIKGREGSFIENAFKKGVTPIAGSVLVCDLSPIPGLVNGSIADHSGIYIGDNTIIHRSGEGYLEKVSPQEFLKRLNGINFAISIHVACYNDEPIGGDLIANRAKEALNDPSFDGYKLLSKNCHTFTKYCLTGNRNEEKMDFTYRSLESLLINKFNVNRWMVWHFDY